MTDEVFEVVVRLKGPRGYEVGRAEAEGVENAAFAARTLRDDDYRANPYQGRRYEAYFVLEGMTVMRREVG